ncbi:unnamed protein product [Cuscuta epithymum]|uniref:Uncharacterized protein n=1 Tax=Cuscuta epithymum TaxID=186058 RepID=A0AAV0FJ65_9ASTE|nr:unnamed protein product [Cuscuta epithymum]
MPSLASFRLLRRFSEVVEIQGTRSSSHLLYPDMFFHWPTIFPATSHFSGF